MPLARARGCHCRPFTCNGTCEVSVLHGLCAATTHTLHTCYTHTHIHLYLALHRCHTEHAQWALHVRDITWPTLREEHSD